MKCDEVTSNFVQASGKHVCWLQAFYEILKVTVHAAAEVRCGKIKMCQHN